ncbi:hypothetical protein D9M71_132770 [compost metagenome]
MDVQCVGAELGADFLGEVAQGDAELAGIGRLVVRGATDDLVILETGRIVRAASRHTEAAVRNVVVGGEVGTAAFQYGLAPLQLVEGLQAQAVGQAEVAVEHGHRQQRFLDLRAGPAQRRHVDRVGRVDAVLEEQALAPVHHLLADTRIERVFAQFEIAEQVGVEQRHALELGQLVEMTVVQLAVGLVAVGGVAEIHFAVFQDVVVPGLAADERPVVAPVQLHFPKQRHGRGYQVALAEVQAAIVAGAPAARVELARRAVADAVGVALEDVVAVGLLGIPDGADAEAAVDAAADLAPLELAGIGSQRHGQGQGRESRRGPCEPTTADLLVNHDAALMLIFM